ncbi:VOC family protein [Jannaschia donghaensis]|uniref:Putative lactoylglutathione lyase n=1 Tax=Jannaschia donghaensis TaxID=420998 RepID=A0A0M6YMJ7_9RHOB|nr:VOC family protein [Jannaschia donghaensis]CTQ51124.1 putative lactoylglutathione lyase [Jannaschia donghaensis]
MISHITLGVADMGRAAPFYRAVASALGLSERVFEDDGGPEMLAFARSGRAAPTLFVTTPFDEAPATAGNGTMVALIARDRRTVDAAYAAGMAHGGTDEGAPGVRENYDAGYYGAYLRDPDGNKLHFVHRDVLEPFL